MNTDRQSIELLAADYTHDISHSRQVAKLADKLFDACKSLHNLGPMEKELLVYAALLHDIGWCGGQQKHHKRSYELILSNPPQGLHERDLLIVANVARYHRKAPPKASHENYVFLPPSDREIVRKLSAILRIADGLDRTHQHKIEIESCVFSATQATISIRTEMNCSEELEAAGKKSDLFQKVYGLRASFRIVQ